jgi:hypothetical protein
MTRIFWIVGLSIALLFYGAWIVVIVTTGITHRHLNHKGVVMLISDAYIVWITYHYLRQKLTEHGKFQSQL